MIKLQINPRAFNPLYWHLMPLLRDPAIRYIYVEGGSSAAKTSEIADALLIDQLAHKYSTIVFRRLHVDIADAVYMTYKEAVSRLDLDQFYTSITDIIRCEQKGIKVRFRGLDEDERIKGIESYNIVHNNEWNQFTEVQWDQQRKRLRGRPNQKFICDWNPVSSKLWQYENWLDKDQWTDLPLTIQAPTKYSALNAEYAFKRINKKGDSVWIKVTYRDNYWVVGHPSGKGGYVDQHTLDDFERDRINKPNLYRVYANGERGIIRTGGEFWKQFNEMKHIRTVRYDPHNTIHVSLDNNVNPYVTASVWQLVGKEIRQIYEIAAKTPDNNAPKAAALFVRLLQRLNYSDVVFVYGDPSARARSTVDANNASFFDKYIQILIDAGYKVVNRVGRSAPQVALSAAFINDIYEHELNGYSIAIGDTCTISADDYANVKEDKDGSMKKEKVTDKATGISYEPYGHFSDAKRYFVISLLKSEFEAYKATQKKYLIFAN